MPLNYLNRLINRIIFRIKMENKTPLYIGSESGRGESYLRLINMPYIKDSEIVYIPLIPSSTIKGAMRHISELILKSYKDLNGIYKYVVDTHIEDEGGKGFHINIENIKEKYKDVKTFGEKMHIDKNVQKYISNLNIEEDKKFSMLLAYYCPVCRIYGSPEFSSKIKISDAIPEKDVVKMYMTHVKIDRKRGIKDEHALYTVEMLSPGAIFNTTIIVDNILPGSFEAKILINTIDYIKTLALQLGGMKSTGLGVLNISDMRISYLDFRKCTMENFIEMLLNPFKYTISYEDLKRKLTVS